MRTTFNRCCAAVALGWLLTVPPASVLLSKWNKDFPHFYMGGLVARHGMWDDLYPIPRPGARHIASEASASDMRPRYAELARQQPLKEPFRFGQSPPCALFYAPLGFLSYRKAFFAWTMLSSLAAWAVALQAGTAYELVLGRANRGAGAVILLIAFAPNTYQSIRFGNTSAFMGVLVGATVLALVGRSQRAAGFSMALSGIMKYATVVLLPLAVVTRRWKLLAWATASGLSIIAATLAVTGPGPFLVFIRDIVPTLGRSNPYRVNQSLHRLLIGATGSFPLQSEVTRVVDAAGALAMIAILAIFFTRRPQTWEQPARVFAAAYLLLAWLNVFSPIFWSHYVFYLYPLWGWLAWESLQSWPRRLVGFSAIILGGVGWSAVPGMRPPVFLENHLLWSSMLASLLALARLLAHPQDGSHAEKEETPPLDASASTTAIG